MRRNQILNELKRMYPKPYFDGWEIHPSYDGGYYARVHATRTKTWGWLGVADGATYSELAKDLANYEGKSNPSPVKDNIRSSRKGFRHNGLSRPGRNGLPSNVEGVCRR